MLRPIWILLFLQLTAHLYCAALQTTEFPNDTFRNQHFHEALKKVLHSRMNSFAELRTGAELFQLPGMKCYFNSKEQVSYLCSTVGLAPAELTKAYIDISLTAKEVFRGYVPCRLYSHIDLKYLELCNFALERFSGIPDVQVLPPSDVTSDVSINIFSPLPGQEAEPENLLHAYALSSLGLQTEAVAAYRAEPPPSVSPRK